MEFKRLLDTLARSSAQAVSTLGHAPEDADKLKHYLYIETDIERDFKVALDSHAEPSSIIFLCGSSGDGKSEILRRYYRDYEDRFMFHVDATHSFKPDQNAIETLNQVFDQHREKQKNLVVGINIGMLFNYATEGAERHCQIKSAITSFTERGCSSSDYLFLNFENYPKFALNDEKTDSSEFISLLLERVVSPVADNPLYQAYVEACGEGEEFQLCQNYRLLQEQSVREQLVDVLLKARLKFDQFLTARTILDFIHHLVCGPDFLFDNLFLKGTNELADILSHFDPCAIRTQRIDQFLVQQSLTIEEPAFEEFKAACIQKYGIDSLKPGGWLRAFYLLQGIEIGNNFHRTYLQDFQRPLYEHYVRFWRMHDRYSGGGEEKQALRQVYQQDIIAALLGFGNRLCPSLTYQKQIFLSEHNGVVVSALAELKPDFKRIQENRPKGIYQFYVCLKLGEHELHPFPVNVSFLELALKINNGYRPNKHDKNTIVILEEVIEDIARVANQARTLQFLCDDRQLTLTHEKEDDEFVVGGAI